MPETNPSDDIRKKLTDGAPTGQPEGDISDREAWWNSRHGHGSLPPRELSEVTAFTFNSKDGLNSFAKALKDEGIAIDLFDKKSGTIGINSKRADLPTEIIDLAKQLGAEISE